MGALVSREALSDWLSRLVRIPSVSPDQAGPRALAAGPLGEAALAGKVAEWFRGLGGEVETDEVLPGRANVYAIWRGETDRWCAVDVHLDTVGVEQMTGDPFSGELRGGRVWGRGAVDTKASLAVILALLETGGKPAPNLLIGATVDEEVGARGAPAFAAWIQDRGLAIDEMVVAEPTGCAPYTAHKGVLRLRFSIEGKPAHSSQPDLGLNALPAAARLILAFEEENERLAGLPPCPPLGQPTLTVTLAEGGRGMNVVPDHASVTIDRRVVTGERTEDIRCQLEALAHRISPLPVSVEPVIAVEAFCQAMNTPWIEQLAEWSGSPPAIAPFCSNAWAYPAVARQVAVLGPGSIAQAHGAEEWVEVSELEKLAQIYARWWRLSE